MLTGVDQTALAALVIAPPLTGTLAWILGRRAPALASKIVAIITGTGLLLAAWLTVDVARGGPVSVGTNVLRIDVDRLAAPLLLLIFGVSVVTQAFAVRYLAGDPRALWFTYGAGLLTGATALMVTATT